MIVSPSLLAADFGNLEREIDMINRSDAEWLHLDSLYHVCVREDYRRLGIGKEMVVHCMNALKAEKINKVSLIAFTANDIGNAFWNTIGWTKREDLNYYDFTLNEANITAFNK